jgi:hypothetical protein
MPTHSVSSKSRSSEIGGSRVCSEQQPQIRGLAHAKGGRAPSTTCFPQLPLHCWPARGSKRRSRKDRSKPLICMRKSGAGEGIRTLDPNLGKVISQNAFGADGGTRTRTLREKQIFLPLRLSPPPVGVRGLDCPFAMASRPKAPPVQSLHLPSIEGLARDWPGARAR